MGRKRHKRYNDLIVALLSEPTDQCMVWDGPLDEDGYGLRFVVPGRRGKTSPHVLACEYAHGVRPTKMVAAHGPCHNPACFNPRHLSWQTPAQNIQDRHRDGSGWGWGERAPNVKLTAAQVREIVTRREAGEPQSAVARAFGISDAAVHLIMRGRTWRQVTGRPRI